MIEQWCQSDIYVGCWLAEVNGRCPAPHWSHPSDTSSDITHNKTWLPFHVHFSTGKNNTALCEAAMKVFEFQGWLSLYDLVSFGGLAWTLVSSFTRQYPQPHTFSNMLTAQFNQRILHEKCLRFISHIMAHAEVNQRESCLQWQYCIVCFLQ